MMRVIVVVQDLSHKLNQGVIVLKQNMKMMILQEKEII